MVIQGGKLADVVIIGGGPAGLSAALWCRELGLDAVLIEREVEVGGQLRTIHNSIANYPGRRANNGRDMLSHFLETVESSGFDRIVYSGVTEIDTTAKLVALADGCELKWKALVIASGVRRRQLGIPGEKEYQGKGIIESGVRDRNLVIGKRVLIVGGGDAAIENALMLSEFAAGVKVVHRRLALTARSEFTSSMSQHQNLSLLTETLAMRILGDSAVTSVELKSVSTGHTWIQPAEAILIRIGVTPNSELVRDVVDVDKAGYIKINAVCETNVAGVFAVGDVANPLAPTISSATGTGATAAKAIFHSLGASKGL
ncbi:MAG: FAD-dependent oxidoreductase [Pyrinomonadaceae bacterium]